MSRNYRTANAILLGRRKRGQRLQLDGRETEHSEPLGSYAETTFRRGNHYIDSTPSIGSLTPTKIGDVIDLCPSPTHGFVEVIDCTVSSDFSGENGGECAFPCVSIHSTENTRFQRSRRKPRFTRTSEQPSNGNSRSVSTAADGSIMESRLK